jgi:hypothetical protein
MLKHCLLALPLILVSAAPPVYARATESAQPTPTPQRPLTEAEVIIDHADLTLEMARDGEFGRIRDHQLRELQDARDTIVALLAEVGDPRELDADQRVELFNAQTRISAIVRNDNKDRKVCRRVMVTGSRVAATECLTVAQREQRRRAAREQAGNLQRGYCLTGPGPAGESVSVCSK